MKDRIKPSDENFNFVDAEHNLLKFWNEKNIFKKSLEKNPSSDPYIFYDGPPFATGLPHHGHLVGSILKDVVPRYWTMKGKFVQRRFGWDCHGLPIEHEIDKSLGMSSSEAVKQLGVKGYNDECRKIVQRYTAQWQKTIERIGRWVDFDNDYKTMDPWYMESVWWVVKQLWEQGLIYKGEKVVPFSTELGTVLSNFEAGSNYKSVQDPALTVLFKLKSEDRYVAAWTTTPWTLPSNLALCVGRDIDYAEVKDLSSGKSLIVSEHYSQDLLKDSEKFESISKLKGSDLVGKKYLPIFDFFQDHEKFGGFSILEDDYVTPENGTGIVHQAPAFGEDDYRIFQKAGIDVPPVCPIDMSGKFTSAVEDFSGLYVKDADKEITKAIRDKGLLFKQEVVQHNYPFCPRSHTPIIYRTIDSWYVKVEEFREQLLEANAEINWVPGHLKNGRMGKWLEGAVDWAISRNRYWGTPLPIWINDETEKRICVGSIDELKSLSGIELNDLHRENVDPVTFRVSGEPGVYRRVEEVLDCWFESGSMPYAQLHYPFENEETFNRGFPAEFIAEGLDQTRGWFYTLIVLGNALFRKNPFKNVVVNGIVMAEDGKKMSKSLRNYSPPEELMETFGADALRLYLINSGLVKGEEQRFSDEGVKDMVRRALLPWLNAFKFLYTYAEIDHWRPEAHFPASTNIMDQWILSRLESLKESVVNEMEGYRLYNVMPSLFEFIEDLTNWYIRLNRARFWTEGTSQDKLSAYHTLYEALVELSISMAPFAPFLSEALYQELKGFSSLDLPESVHLCSYPEGNKKRIKPLLESAVQRMQHIILLGRQKRNQEKLKTKYPVSEVTIIHPDEKLLKEISKLENYLQQELNARDISYSKNEENFIKLYAKPNSRILGKRLGKDFKEYKKAIEELTSSDINRLREEEKITIKNEDFDLEDILVFREAKQGNNTVSNKFISIDMDCNLDSELIAQGQAREVVNRIQKSRKDFGLKVNDRIKLAIKAGPVLESVIKTHEKYIKSETLTTQLNFTATEQRFSFEIDEHEFSISIETDSL
ncbi:MAG: isoleucine--tRNA ligase [Candidatus Azotimanducaceae bacterium]